MTLRLETPNFRVFELVTDARVELEKYSSRREPARLNAAEDKLKQALEKDPAYLNAVYYLGITEELQGRRNDAIERYKQVLSAHPPFAEEVTYHLALANFHRYHREDLEEAERNYLRVIELSDNERLVAAAHAGLAQVYSHLMIPKSPASANHAEIEHFFLLCDSERRKVEAAFPPDAERDPFWREVVWTSENARGTSLYFYSDYLPESGNLQTEAVREKKLNLLKGSLQALQTADRYSPDNWAIACNLASVHMRLGYWSATQADRAKHFGEARAYLFDVIKRLRPNYSFALYEMGRVERISGHFEEAIEYYKRALDIPESDRDVSTKRLKMEITRAAERQSEFP